jgi:hypothetical protein
MHTWHERSRHLSVFVHFSADTVPDNQLCWYLDWKEAYLKDRLCPDL